MADPAKREVLLTLTPGQHAALAADVAKLRQRLGTPNVTQTIIEAVRQATATESRG